MIINNIVTDDILDKKLSEEKSFAQNVEYQHIGENFVIIVARNWSENKCMIEEIIER